MEGKTLEELRKNMESTCESLTLEMGLGGTGEEDKKAAKEEVAEFENAVRADEQERLAKPMTEVEKCSDELAKAVSQYLTGQCKWMFREAEDHAQDMVQELVLAVRNEKK